MFSRKKSPLTNTTIALGFLLGAWRIRPFRFAFLLLLLAPAALPLAAAAAAAAVAIGVAFLPLMAIALVWQDTLFSFF